VWNFLFWHHNSFLHKIEYACTPSTRIFDCVVLTGLLSFLWDFSLNNFNHVYSRRNHHYHSQRSARNVDLTHYHPFNGVSPIVNGHKLAQPHQQPSQHHQPQSMQHHMRPISSYYEYEMINPNGHYRKLNDQFIPLQNSNSSSKIVNGSSSVRITGNNMRGPIPDMKQHRGPFITQVRYF
jgi:hypothetical protein